MDAMDGKKVIVTYTDEFGLWKSISEDFKKHLPLHDLQWKSSNRPARSIQTLRIELRPLASEAKAKSHMIPETLLEKPCLNLYLLNCDDNEDYRQTVKKQIRDWVNVVTSKKNQEWLIIYTSQETIRNTAVKLFNMKATVFDRIKADFNQSKRDRCVQLRPSEGDFEDREGWQELISKIKEGILSSFDQHVIQYEEEIRRSDSQRIKPGWNYCTFFVQKEGLAQSFEIMNLYEDALVQYDELEASFFQVLKDRALAWFGHFGGTEHGDDSANILDIKKKPYRDLIMQNAISVFDFRSYLFARQFQLLGRLQKPVEICHRAKLFISSFARSIKDSKEFVGEHFLESWIYSSCSNVVNECEELIPLNGTDEPLSIAFSAAKGELLDLARKQLDKLGIHFGCLPSDIPFITALDETKTPTLVDQNEESKKISAITNKELLKALNSADDFDTLYVTQTNKALRAYQDSTRVRSSLRLQGDIAALHFHRKKYDIAIKTMENLPQKYGEQGWTVIENSLLVKCAACQKELGQLRDYAASCLTLLKNYALLSEEEVKLYGEELKSLSASLDKELVRPFKPMFTIVVTSIVDNVNDDEPYLGVELKNNLPTAFKFDQLAVRLVSSQSDEIWFVIRDGGFEQGSSSFRLYSDNTACGSYVVANCRLDIGKVIFTHDFLKEGKKKSFRISEHPTILRAQVIAPTEIHIGEQQYFIAQIFTGLKDITDGNLTLNPMSDGLSFPSRPTYQAEIKAVVDDIISDEVIKEEELVPTETGIRIPPCESNKLIQLKIPYDCNWGSIEHKVKISVEYTSKNKKRIFTSIDIVKVWLPLTVTEFFIFRDDCLFLKMDISSNGSGTLPLRILSCSLLPSKMYNVIDNASETQQIMTLFPKQHASFVYKLSRKSDNEDEPAKTTSTQVHFIVEYRTLKDEIEHFVKNKINNVLRSQNLLQHSTFVVETVNEHLLKNVDYHWYGMSDKLDLGELDVGQCEKLFQTHGDVKTALINIIEDFWKSYKEVSGNDIAEIVKDFKQITSFPIDVPLSKALNTVELIITKSNQLVVGEPCHCHVIIRQSSYWNYAPPTEDKEAPLEFFYDVHVDFDNWLLSGHKKFCFSSKVGETKEFPITLVPLKTGHLLVPIIRVSATSSNIFSETVYVNNAQQVLVRPRTQSATFFIEQRHRIHSVNSGVGFGGPGHHELGDIGVDN